METERDSAPPYSEAWLEALHGLAASHAPCLVDHECRSPLRCWEGTCRWPAAMRGEVEGAPVVVTLQGSEGVHRFRLELAEGRREQERGLMHRRAMHPDFGMVFPYADEAIRSFWMANTLIPLDMIFINRAGEIVTILHEAEPLTRTPRTSSGPAQFVVELVGGTAARLGIEEGSVVEWEGLPARWLPAEP